MIFRKWEFCLQWKNQNFFTPGVMFIVLFRHLNVPYPKLSFRTLLVFTGDQKFSVGEFPMAVHEILNNLPQTSSTSCQILIILSLRWVQWNCHGVILWDMCMKLHISLSCISWVNVLGTAFHTNFLLTFICKSSFLSLPVLQFPRVYQCIIWENPCFLLC